MIHLSSIAVEDKTDENKDWKALLSESRLTLEELLKKVGLDHHPEANEQASKSFEIRAPAPYLAKIRLNDPNDPLLLQILPTIEEDEAQPGYLEDPLDEANFTAVTGIIHKYKRRVLLIASQTCVINCRYCFRRNFPYEAHRQSKHDWSQRLDYIRQNSDINEVILSGGDPLANNNDYLFWLLEQIDDIAHVKRIRIHTRLLVTLPQRADPEFIKMLERLRTKVIIVLHCNHPNELGPVEISTLKEIRSIGVTVLNQSVLLNRVNNSADTLVELSEKLFEADVQPYYLFLLDKVKGTAHFDVSEAEASEIYRAMQAELPGFLMPKLAREIPGETSKTLLIPSQSKI